ncbi:SusC/RagA family TonB-linked outer membrane protein [Algibacter miyuki]|uniref:SusC/RagA family TonB-linked outer membrane protein n=1 Tax=Algibacter miyuki TaxID=1306933 RepID=A0ABV5H508_9FLAO|nr:TonB-dependent receptor [Algibacter miyuki]MDN3665786.1 TonB-dependent receptor [Algibacter miyuki]
MRAFIFLLCTTVFSFTPDNVLSQNVKITINADKTITVDQIFDLIMNQTDYTFIYQVNMFKDYPKIHLRKGTVKVNNLLERSLSNGDFSIKCIENNTILIVENEAVQSKVSGIVTDNNGVPAAGVNVLEKGTKNGTFTDFDGKYTIIATKGSVLVFSYVGLKTKEIVVANSLEISVTLETDSESLDAVVLVGYGSQKKRDLTGSVSTINVGEINKSNPISLDNALIGRASGVHVVTASGAPGSEASIRIRGLTSVFGNNEPLYVIDGLPIEIGQGLGNSFYAESSYSQLSPLSSINPQDIESIDILKDASATAIYGSRGANGVIIVTTKKGSYSSVPSISLSGTTSISRFTNDYSMLNSEQFHDVIEQAYGNAGANLPADSSLYPYGTNVNTDWKEETDQGAINTNYYLNANGGSLNGSSLYSLSAGVTDQKGAILGTSFKRNTLRTKLETKLSDKLRVGTNFNYNDSENKGRGNTFYYQTVKYRPDIPIYDENGDYAYDAPSFSFQANPYAKTTYPNSVTNKSIILSLFGEYEITKGLFFKTTYSYRTSDNSSFRYTPSYDPLELAYSRKGTLKQGENTFSSRVLDNTLNFNKKINKHDINSVIGVSHTQNKSEYSNVNATNFPDDEVLITPGAASNVALTTGGTISGLSSSFLRVNYNYSNKYYVTFTGRADKSTKFGPENRWGYFPSGAIAWRISKESFLEDVDFVNDLKFRTSYGKTGSANFSDFQYDTFFAAGSFYNNNNGVVSNTIPNPNIRWETTNQLDVSLDYSLWDRRINGSLGYFNKKTSDQILLRDVILETGGSSQFSNIGDFLNKGFEFQIGIDVISTDKFQWTTDLNITSIKSKVLKLNGGYYNNLIEGESISYFSGYKVAGIFQNQTEIDDLNTNSPNGVYQSANTAPGDFKFADVNGDGYIGDDDNNIIGKAEPDFFGGWSNIIRIGNFEVSALFNFSVGNYLYNTNKTDLLIFDTHTNNYSTGILDAWSPTNTNTDIPRLALRDPNNNSRNSDFFIEDASFFRLKNINVTYKLNPSLLKKLFIQRASLSLSASNIFVITSYSGLDPEVNYNGSNNFRQGYDTASYPPVKTISLGLNLNL